jgi:hypothetical protein
LEVPVPRNQPQVVLQRDRGDPEIVVGNRSAGPLELNKQPGVVLRSLTAGQHNPVSQEFSIRIALGAQQRDIMLLALRPGAILTLTGVALRLMAAQGATHLMAILLFGVSPADT